MRRRILVLAVVLLSIVGASWADAATLAYWRFETDNGVAVTNGKAFIQVDDVSGNGSHLTPLGTFTTSSYKTNKVDEPLFDVIVPRTQATNLAYASFTASDTGLKRASYSGFNGLNNFTVELYIRRTAATGGAVRELCDVEGSGPQGFLLELSGAANELTVNHPGYGTLTTSGANLQCWKTYHVAYVRSNGTDRVYVDGRLVLNGTCGSGTSLSGVTLSLGARANNTSMFPGDIDEVRISNVALQPREFLRRDTTVGYWRFESDSGTAAIQGQAIVGVDDASGNGWTLTNVTSGTVYTNNLVFGLTRGPDRLTGWFRSSTLGNAGFKEVVGTDAFTFETFFRASASNTKLFQLGDLYGFLSSGNPFQMRWIYLGYFDVTVATSMKLDTSYHLAVVRTNGAYRLYLDGTLIDTHTAPAIGSAGLLLGAAHSSYGRYSGLMDEVRVSGTALSTQAFLRASVAALGLARPAPSWPSPIFHWGVHDGWDYSLSRIVIRTDGIFNCPFPGTEWGADWWGFYQQVTPKGLYPQMVDAGYPVALMLTSTSGPLAGANSNALHVVMTNLSQRALPLDYVFSDIETTGNYGETCEIVDQVRGFGNAAITNARIGCYPYYPGAADDSMCHPWSVDRSQESQRYFESGVDCAMPDCYPYAAISEHTNPSLWGPDVCPNDRAALLWAPLERLSLTIRNLPTNHQTIAWISGFMTMDGYATNAPTVSDNQASVIHYRLRGADGLYMLQYAVDEEGQVPDGYYGATTYPTEEAYATDMLAQWTSLDSFFAGSGTTTFLNLKTSKTTGLNWSGAIRGQTAKVLVSNMGSAGTAAQRVHYPTGYGLPPYSDYVQSGQHWAFTYNLAPTASNGSLNVVPGGSAFGTLFGSDLSGESMSYTIVANGVKGTATVTDARSGSYTYTANSGMSGTDTFTFKCAGGGGTSAVATVTMSITP